MTKVDEYLIPEVATKGFIQRPNIVLVSYSDGPSVFFKNQFALVQSAADKGFDHIYSFKRSHISPDFWENNKLILEHPRGSGYWLWKPYFILKAMKEQPLGSIIFYADSSVVFKKPIGPLVKLLDQYNMIIPINGTFNPVVSQIKKEAYAAFDKPLTDDILQNPATWAFFIALKNTPENQLFIEKWLKTCGNAPAVMDQPQDKDSQMPGFDMHLHDQALLSVLVAFEPQNKLLMKRYTLRGEYGVHNFHRHDDHRYQSPLWLIAGMSKGFSVLLWNNTLITYIRELIYG
jgi:hypothetical protein